MGTQRIFGLLSSPHHVRRSPKYAELEVRNNDDFKTPKESRSQDPADAFLFWRYYIDIEPKEEVEKSVYIAFISKLLLDLRSQGINAVAACGFEDELSVS